MVEKGRRARWGGADSNFWRLFSKQADTHTPSNSNCRESEWSPGKESRLLQRRLNSSTICNSFIRIGLAE